MFCLSSGKSEKFKKESTYRCLDAKSEIHNYLKRFQICGIMKIFISVHWQAQTLNYEVVPSLLMTLCAERVVSCVATRCLRHNNGHDAVPFNSVLVGIVVGVLVVSEQ